MRATPMTSPDTRRDAGQTHDVFNVGAELCDYNMYAHDVALQEAVHREGAAWAESDLQRFGALTGAADYLELGRQANQHPPELDTHDRFGHRVDLVRFHPAYHALMRQAVSEGLHAAPWREPRGGAHVARAAKFYLQSQVEAGHGCPVTMTFACTPALQAAPDLAERWLPKIHALSYDARNVPAAQKEGLTIGMAMTEKQGGSDVRANTTTAHPLGRTEEGDLYELVGHKYFVSAPMCDAFLVLAQAPGGLTCFLLPRWRSDGSKNPLQIIRLKRKMGNVSNASTETELRGAHAWRVGDEGRGVRTIIEMVSLTRFDCMIGSAAGQRAAISHVLHHCQRRAVFGKPLLEQALMQNVLTDLVLESEGSLALSMRMARALDSAATSEHETLLARLMTAVGKYWICKRTPQHAYEAMECIGGSGVMEDSPYPRLFRESPVNAIWEGSGNVQCLDVLRALQKTPDVLQAYFQELSLTHGEHPGLDRYVSELEKRLYDPRDVEYRARDVVARMALAMQASLLWRHAPQAVAHAFSASRLGEDGGGAGHHHYGELPVGIDCPTILKRALPRG